MTLQEAIEEVKEYCGSIPEWDESDINARQDASVRAAIATILNAVVKGELK